MTSTICAAAVVVKTPRRRLVAAVPVSCWKLVRRALTFKERYIGVRETNPDEEGNDACDRFEFTDFDVARCVASSDQEFFHTGVSDI